MIKNPFEGKPQVEKSVWKLDCAHQTDKLQRVKSRIEISDKFATGCQQKALFCFPAL